MIIDNALSMYEATKKAHEQLMKINGPEHDKLQKRVEILTEKKDKTKEEIKTLNDLKIQLKDKEKLIRDLDFKKKVELAAFKNKASESRQDLAELQKTLEEVKRIKYVKAVPCMVYEAHKYFTKNMFKNEKGEWVESEDKESTEWISNLLADKVIEPKMSVSEWEKTNPVFRYSIKETIAEISFYKRPSPKEILVERRRSEQIKNIFGDSEE